MAISSIVIVILFSVIFGAILYILTHFLLKKFGKDVRGTRTKHIWVWRSVIFLIIIYMIIVLFLNRNALDIALVGPFNFIVMAFLLVFFFTLLEVAVIDLLLPDVLHLWKRIALEIVIFFLLGGSSITMFIMYSRLAGV